MIYVLRFTLLLLFSCNVWGENIKSPTPGLSEPKIRKRYNRQSNPGVASCIGLRDQSHVAEAILGVMLSACVVMLRHFTSN